MPAPAALEITAAAAREHGRRLDGAERLRHRRRERRRHDEDPPRDFHRDVLVVGVNGDREARGQRPGRRRPHRRGGSAQAREGRRQRRHERVCHVDRRRGELGILDLRLGERGGARRAPVDGLLAAVEQPFGDDAPEDPHLLGLVRGVHGQVRAVPIPEDAEALELLALDRDVALRVRPAPLADVELGQIRFPPDLALDLELDRQPVAVPSRDVRRETPAHRAVLHDHVLQDLVQRVADVDVAVGVRRSVVQDEARAPGVRLEKLVVEAHRLPAAENLGLPLREIRAHRELRTRQVERLAVIHRGERPR